MGRNIKKMEGFFTNCHFDGNVYQFLCQFLEDWYWIGNVDVRAYTFSITESRI